MKKRMQKIAGLSLVLFGLFTQSNAQAQRAIETVPGDQIEMRHERRHVRADFKKHRKAEHRHEAVRRNPQARQKMHKRSHMRNDRPRPAMRRHDRMHRQPMSKQQSLDQAYKSGAISKKQYKKAHKRIAKERVSH